MALEERAIDIANQVEHEDIKACALRHLLEVIAAEREACAVECDKEETEMGYDSRGSRCAEYIRARGEAKSC